MITLQSVCNPQEIGHKFVHFCFTHDWVAGQSEFETHSGLHIGGLPTYVGKQEHTATSLTTLHLLFGPHSVLLHGLVLSMSVSKV